MEKKDLNVVFSHKTDSWATPEWLFRKLDSIYHFTLDPASDHLNHKCVKHYTLEDDGLKQDWKNETVFINPPYSKTYDWVKKAHNEAKENGVTSVMLLASRTDTRWFHDFCLDGSAVRELIFIKGRIKFGDQKNAAPFPSLIVVFGKNDLDSPLFSTMTNKQS